MAQGPGFVGGGAHDVHAQFSRCIGPANRHHGMNRAADGRVQQRWHTSRVHAAEWVVVLELRRSLKDGFAGADLHQREVEGVGDVREGQIAL